MEKAEEGVKAKNERSIAYPGIPLGDAIEYNSKLRGSLGKGPYSRQDAAKALGHAKLTGPAARKVAALVHYGLLERSGNTYSQSPLSQDIFQPLSEEQKNLAVKRAAVNPRLFKGLCQKFSGQALPTMLQNIVIREGVSEGAGAEVVRIFKETMTFAGLLMNGVLADFPVLEDSEEQELKSSVSPGMLPSPDGTSSLSPSAPIMDAKSTFIFEFQGNIQLLIPRNKGTSDAIADGELKEVRRVLVEFAEKHCSKTSESSPQVS